MCPKCLGCKGLHQRGAAPRANPLRGRGLGVDGLRADDEVIRRAYVAVLVTHGDEGMEVGFSSLTGGVVGEDITVHFRDVVDHGVP